MNTRLFYKNGWRLINFDPVLKAWVDKVLPCAREQVNAKRNRQWLRCNGTWFAGVNVLPNTGLGEVGDSGPLAGTAMEFIRQSLRITDFDLDPGQISVCYPGYPRAGASETPQSHRYRLRRDAAHVDGLLPEGPDRRRHLREYHAFILGIPMVAFSSDAAPFVVWEGSHEIIRQTFRSAWHKLPPEQWGDLDITEIYKQARRTIFSQCRRVLIHARPGESFVVHRLALHGTAPWRENAEAGPDGRMICFFRPQAGGPDNWLNAP